MARARASARALAMALALSLSLARALALTLALALAMASGLGHGPSPGERSARVSQYSLWWCCPRHVSSALILACCEADAKLFFIWCSPRTFLPSSCFPHGAHPDIDAYIKTQGLYIEPLQPGPLSPRIGDSLCCPKLLPTLKRIPSASAPS